MSHHIYRIFPVSIFCNVPDVDLEFSGIDEPATFLASEERQECLKYILDNVRARKGDRIGEWQLRDGQAISE